MLVIKGKSSKKTFVAYLKVKRNVLNKCRKINKLVLQVGVGVAEYFCSMLLCLILSLFLLTTKYLGMTGTRKDSEHQLFILKALQCVRFDGYSGEKELTKKRAELVIKILNEP